ncbi:MATE family efflux transporter [Seleniivibrio woodruffii]|uniref:MATE family efflux transporter n=1 Tax=Seleniivibrio woodruffii TaxID=1078050 RepID=UPI0026EB9A8A|nr:MATE family efflux transporter [Seleniivibrio woodruffii]
MIVINDRYRRVLAISLPSAFHNLMNMVQTMIDMLFVGRISAVSLASVGVSMQYTALLYAFMSLVYVGTNVLVSRFYGSKDMEKAGQTIYVMILFSFVISLPLMFFCLFHSSVLFEILGTGKDVVHEGTIYISNYSYALPALFVQGVLFSGLNALGKTKIPLYISISGNLMNVFLDWVMIFGHFGFPAMGIKGAALATVIVIYYQLIVYFICYFSGRGIRIIPSFDMDLLKRGIRVAVPAWLERIVAHPSYLVLSALVAKFGVDALAGYQVGLRIEGLAFMPGVGFIFASMALVGQGLGAGKPDEAEKDAYAATVSASVIMGILGLLMTIFPYALARLFTDNQATIENAAWYLRIMGISQVPLAVCFVLSGSLRGAGDTNMTFAINAVSLWGLRILPAWLLTFYVTDSVWVYLVAMIESVVRAAVLLIRFRSGKWKSINV